MRQKLLKYLEGNAKYTEKELAELLNVTEDDIKKEIGTLEDEGVIQGYKTMIDWEKEIPEMVEAIIELKVSPQKGVGFDMVASEISALPQVRSVYLVSGGFDLAVIVRGLSMKEIALFVGERLATIDTVLSTATHFLLNTYKKDGKILLAQKKDERVIGL